LPIGDETNGAKS